MSIIITIILFSALIIVHELGHYLAARRAGVRVEKFGIGFGPALFKIKGKETEFSICLFPLGGFVKLAGDVRDDCKGDKSEFYSQPVGVRAKIVFWGPLFNLFLTFFLYWIIFYFSGIPTQKPLIGEIVKYDSVSKDKFNPTDLKILIEKGVVEEIDGDQKYITWIPQDLKNKLINASFEEKEVKRFLNIWDDSFKITNKNMFQAEQLKKLLEMDLLGEKVVSWNIVSEEELKNKLLDVEGIDKDSICKVLLGSRYPANKAGIEVGDLITKINGVTVGNWNKMSKLIQNSEGIINVELKRIDQIINLDVKPEKVLLIDIDGEREISLIGIRSMTTKSGFTNSFVAAGKKFYELSGTVLKGFG
ncbi:MAG: RIP metalloprotease RseP, partial [Candidatus Omnitrophica bacterium]|nr:RIP metalloprotease RseP [Candidatus Omnitrophota bacterium]